MIKNTERKRITKIYLRRGELINSWRYSSINPSYLFQRQSFDRQLLLSLKKSGLTDLANIQILDIGCGNGELLNFLVSIGAKPENCFGVDILNDRISLAKRKNPSMHLACLNAEKLPFMDEKFDLIIQATTFSSVKNKSLKRRIANEMQRVLKPDGMIFWYDFFINNPNNPDAMAIKKNELSFLFKNQQKSITKITLAPPISRLLISNNFYFIAYLLEKIRLLNSHYFAVIKKNLENRNETLTLRMSAEDIRSAAKIHRESFKNYPHSRLGEYYAEKFLSWFKNDHKSGAFVASKNGETLGYILGAPVGYRRMFNIQMMPVVAVSILIRPWLIFSPLVFSGLINRLKSQRKNQNIEDVKINLPKPVFCLESVAVDSRWRGQGVGKKLDKTIKQYALMSGMKSMILYVDKNNNTATNFYRKNGWKILRSNEDRLLEYYLLDKKTDEK